MIGQAIPKTKPGLRYYWQIFLRRKWLIILPIIATVSVAIPGSFLMDPTFLASTTLITEEMERGSLLSSVGNIPVPPSERMDTIRIKIGSRRFTRELIDKVDIASYLKSTGKPSDMESMVKYLRNIVKVRARGGRLLEISVMHPIPTIARDIANAVANLYVDNTLRWRQDTTSETANFIKQQMDFYWQRLSEAEEALVKAQEKSPLGYLSEEADTLVNQTAGLKTELFEAELDLGEAKAELEKAKAFPQSGEPESDASPLYLDPEIARLQTKLTGLQKQYAELSMRYSDQYPEVKKVKMEITRAQNDLDEAKAKFRAQQQSISGRLQYWQDRVRVLEAKKTALSDRIGQYDRKLQLLPQRELEIARLRREKSYADNTYTMLLHRLNTLELIQVSEMHNMGRVAEVLDPAIEPEKPVRPNKKKIALLAIMMGMFMGFGSTFLLEYFDQSFRSVEEAADYLGVPVLASIPRLTTYESELKKRRHKYVMIVCMVLCSLLTLSVIADIVSAEFLERNSFFLNVARLGFGFLKSVIKV